MKRCQMKKGFFVLTECGDVAVAQCYSCKKHFCIAHCQNYFKIPTEEQAKSDETLLKEPNDPDKIICVECYTRQHKEELEKNIPQGLLKTPTKTIFFGTCICAIASIPIPIIAPSTTTIPRALAVAKAATWTRAMQEEDSTTAKRALQYS